MLKPVLTILIFLYVHVGKTTAQYSFVNYDYTNGLPLDEIKAIAEDSIGYIWLGGPLGLSRFDGRSFTHYNKNSPTDNVAGNIVNDIEVTPGGNIVVVYDDNGISIYDHKEGTFRSKIHTVADSSGFPKHSIVFVHILNDTCAYIGANREGLYQINLKTLQSKRLPVKQSPYDIIEDPVKKGDFILAGHRGLKRMDGNDFSIKKIFETGFSGLKIINGKVWANSYSSQMCSYDLKEEKGTIYPLFFKSVIRGWAMVDQNLWVGTAKGIEIIDTATAEVISILKTGPSSKDLQSSFIYDVFKDSKGRIWIATDGGLSLYDPRKPYFERTKWLSFQSTNLAPLSNHEMLSMDFYSNEIFHLDKDKNKSIIHIKDELKGPIQRLAKNGEDYIIFYNGIGKYDVEKKVVMAASTLFTESKEKSLIQVLTHENNWMGIYRHKHIFVVWNSATNESDTLALGGEPRGMIDTKDGNVWVYGIGILWKYNLNTKTSIRNSLNSVELANLSGDIIQIDEAEDGYWISTRINGIWKANYNNEKFHLTKHYSSREGLTNNNVIHCYTDDHKAFYVQCRSGLFVHDKVQDRFISLGGKNGINIQTSYGLAVIDSMFHVLGYKSKSINLRKVKTSQNELKTVIEGIHINGQRIYGIGTKTNSLKHNENNIEISFSTFEYTDPSSIRHRYRLDSLNDWIYNEPNSGTIQLSALAAGDYLFQLAATDGSGQWTEPINWEFSISPPHWRSWWFVLSILCLLIFIGYLIFQYRMKQMERINNMKVKLAELEGESLRAQMNPHFVFNALNSIKSYIIKNRKEEAADYLTTFSELIRAVLRNSTKKEISLKDEIEALTLYLQIENLRLNQPFEYEINIDEDINPVATAFPPLIIQPFVENSIWHGFAHKKKAGKLMLDIRKDGEKLSIDVIDDGVGRKKSKEIEKSRERKRSYGIAITETRLNNIADKADTQIIDLYDNEGESIGTKVHIELPLKRVEAKNQ